MNFIGSFLSVTTAVAIASSPFTAIANTAQEIALPRTPTALQIDSSLQRGSVVTILHFSRKRDILVSQEEDPRPPRPALPGGSR